MKFLRHLHFMFLLVIPLLNNAQKINRDLDLAEYEVTGPVKLLKVHSQILTAKLIFDLSRHFDKKGNIITQTEYRAGVLKDSFINMYNEAGLKIKTEMYDSVGYNSKILYEYNKGIIVADTCHDKENRKISLNEYDSIGNLTQVTSWGKYKYNYQIQSTYNNGILVKEICNSIGKNVTTLFTYDEKGNNVEQKIYVGNSPLFYKNIIKFDRNGNKIQFLDYSTDGSIERKVIRKYNKYGNIVKREEYKANNILSGQTTYAYEYDAQHNWIKRTTYNFGSETQIDTRVIDYY